MTFIELHRSIRQMKLELPEDGSGKPSIHVNAAGMKQLCEESESLTEKHCSNMVDIEGVPIVQDLPDNGDALVRLVYRPRPDAD